MKFNYQIFSLILISISLINAYSVSEALNLKVSQYSCNDLDKLQRIQGSLNELMSYSKDQLSTELRPLNDAAQSLFDSLSLASDADQHYYENRKENDDIGLKYYYGKEATTELDSLIKDHAYYLRNYNSVQLLLSKKMDNLNQKIASCLPRSPRLGSSGPSALPTVVEEGQQEDLGNIELGLAPTQEEDQEVFDLTLEQENQQYEDIGLEDYSESTSKLQTLTFEEPKLNQKKNALRHQKQEHHHHHRHHHDNN